MIRVALAYPDNHKSITLLDQVVAVLRVCHYAFKTEKVL